MSMIVLLRTTVSKKLRKICSHTVVMGQSIVEVLVATVVVSLVMTSIVAAMTLSIQSTAESRARSMATKLAQEGIELFRRERAAMGWAQFRSSSLDGAAVQTYCLNAIPSNSIGFRALSPGTCGSATIDDSSMQREVEVRSTDPTALRVIVTVTWQDGTDTRSSEVVQLFRQVN